MCRRYSGVKSAVTFCPLPSGSNLTCFFSVLPDSLCIPQGWDISLCPPRRPHRCPCVRRLLRPVNAHRWIWVPFHLTCGNSSERAVLSQLVLPTLRQTLNHINVRLDFDQYSEVALIFDLSWSWTVQAAKRIPPCVIFRLPFRGVRCSRISWGSL